MVHSVEIFDFELELLTPLWQDVLGLHCSATDHAARQRFTLLGDGTRCSATAHNCSATHHGGRTMSLAAQLCSHLLRQAQDSVAQWVQGARGLAVGGTTLDTHDRPHGLRPQGRPSPQDEALWGTTLLGVSRRHWEDILKILRDLLGYV